MIHNRLDFAFLLPFIEQFPKSAFTFFYLGNLSKIGSLNKQTKNGADTLKMAH